ncbi:MAG: hypothetical protein Kow0032_13880 [Methyloligellaceae bacterium]
MCQREGIAGSGRAQLAGLAQKLGREMKEQGHQAGDHCDRTTAHKPAAKASRGELRQRADEEQIDEERRACAQIGSDLQEVAGALMQGVDIDPGPLTGLRPSSGTGKGEACEREMEGEDGGCEGQKQGGEKQAVAQRRNIVISQSGHAFLPSGTSRSLASGTLSPHA